jgi:hypothetical protein
VGVVRRVVAPCAPPTDKAGGKKNLFSKKKKKKKKKKEKKKKKKSSFAHVTPLQMPRYALRNRSNVPVEAPEPAKRRSARRTLRSASSQQHASLTSDVELVVSGNNSDVQLEPAVPVGATQAHVAVRGSLRVRPDAASGRKRKIESQASFMIHPGAPTAAFDAAFASTSSTASAATTAAKVADAAELCGARKRTALEPSVPVTLSAVPHEQVTVQTTTERLQKYEVALYDIEASDSDADDDSSSSTTANSVNDDDDDDGDSNSNNNDSCDAESFLNSSLYRVGDKPSPHFSYMTPYKAPTKSAQTTLVMSTSEPFSADDELEYIDETAALMEKRDYFYSPSASWLQLHPELKSSMRAVLLDWLRELSCPEGGYKLSRVTFQTAANLFDRFMSRFKGVPRTKVQLIGAVALLVSSKLEESYRAPNVETLLFYCDGLYKRSELLRVEQAMLRSLDWRVTPPTPHVYAKLILTRKSIVEDASRERDGSCLHREVRRATFDTAWLTRAMQLLDTALLDNECLRYCTSTLAIAALACVRIKNNDETAAQALGVILPHYCPRLPGTPPKKTAATASTTPALVSNRTPQTRITHELQACVAWMATYNDVPVPRWEDDHETACDQQDWNRASLERVRLRLRERAQQQPQDPARHLVV